VEDAKQLYLDMVNRGVMYLFYRVEIFDAGGTGQPAGAAGGGRCELLC